MMPAAQCDEVGEIGLTPQYPRQHVMHLGEVGESATREPTALVPAIDLDTLRHRRTPPGPFLVENAAVAALQRENHLRVAGQTTGNFPGNRPDPRQIRGPGRILARQQIQIGMHHEGGTKPGCRAVRKARVGLPTILGRAISPTHVHECVIEPLVEWGVRTRGIARIGPRTGSGGANCGAIAASPRPEVAVPSTPSHDTRAIMAALASA